MKWNSKNLRRTSGVKGLIPWKDPSVAFVYLHMNETTCEISYARTVGEKRALLDACGSADCLLVAWPGQYAQDIFVLDTVDEARGVLFAPPAKRR